MSPARAEMGRSRLVGRRIADLPNPAFWLIVPGSLGFTALAGVLTSDQSLSSLGPEAAFTFIAMAIGSMLASLFWAWFPASRVKARNA